MDITAAVEDIRRRIGTACRSVGRDADEITLLAATKTRSAEEIRTAVSAGVDALGENRADELDRKYPLGAYEGLPLHFIGALQTNKAKLLVGRVDLIHSVDSEHLLKTLSRLALERGVRQDVLVGVNIASEAAKSGVAPDRVEAFCDLACRTEGLRLRGLTAIPPALEPPERHFELAADLFSRIKSNSPDGFDTLSIGMSNDFETAIAYGSTVVRIGRAIFGERIYR
ncbi:MAG: YggS family pyridoxal phosphate-dependent enzyme [Clostridia bacterium]|nr:YggS family pyridoxal phosphate-dependent enzyme [Clostridia bacterium]